MSTKLFGSAWHEYSPPSVLHWFSPQDLKRLAAQYGFEVVVQGRPQKWLNGAGRLLKALLKLVSDRLKIPYPAKDLFWILFQEK